MTDLDALAERLYAAVVSDALDAFGHADRAMAGRLRPVNGLARPLVGRAATARAVPVASRPERPYAVLIEALDGLTAGDVLVIAAGGRVRSGIFGGLLATAARARGAVGCIVDGGVRDVRELARMGFPTFAAGCSPADSLGRDEVVEHGCEVSCAGTVVRPGELIVADADGVVTVPAEVEADVVAHALAKVEGEGSMRAELAAGLPVADAFTKYGIL